MGDRRFANERLSTHDNDAVEAGAYRGRRIRRLTAPRAGIVAAAIGMLAGLALPTQASAQAWPLGEANDTGDGIEADWSTALLDDELDNDDLDELSRTARRPIPLRTATAAALERLPGITPERARVILDAVDRGVADFDQLDTAVALNPGERTALRAYTTLALRTRREIEGLEVELRTHARWELQQRAGLRPSLERLRVRRNAASGDSLGMDTIIVGSAWMGDRLAAGMRIIARAPGIAVAITGDKDAGEPVVIDDTTSYTYAAHELADTAAPVVARRFAAFASAGIALDLGRWRLFAGDFSVSFARGLLFGSAFGSVSGDGPVAPFRPDRGVRLHTSADETGFLRGAAVELRDDSTAGTGIAFTAFASERMLDASITAGDSITPERITTLRTDGRRRTHAELRRSANISETIIGCRGVLRLRGSRLGVTAYHSRFSLPFDSEALFGPIGSAHTMLGADITATAGDVGIFGEAAVGTNGGAAFTAGATGRAARLEWGAAVRWFASAFMTPHGSTFAAAPVAPHNEQGLYLAAALPLASWLRVSASIDLFEHPDRSPLVPFPRGGADARIRLEVRPQRGLTIVARIARATGADRSIIPDSLERDRVRLVDRDAVILHFEASWHPPRSPWTVGARYSRNAGGFGVTQAAVSGTLTMIDVRYAPAGLLTAGLHVCLFDTDGPDAAIAVVEQDLPGHPVALRLSGAGRRLGCYLRWRPISWLALAGTYGETLYGDRSVISPGGSDEIAGPLASSVGFSVEARW